MSLIQVSSSQYNPNAQTGEGSEEMLGNTGSTFTNRFQSVLKIPPNAQIGLAQAVFQDSKTGGVNADDVQTANRKEPAFALLFGGYEDNEYNTFYDNLKIFEAEQNFSPVELPLVLYAPKGKYNSYLDYWEEIVKQLNLYAPPELQGAFSVSTSSSTGGIITMNIKADYNLYSNVTGVDGSKYLDEGLTILSNDELGRVYNDDPEDLLPLEEQYPVSMNPIIVSGEITGFQVSRYAGYDEGFKWYQRVGLAQTTFNGFHDAGGYVQIDKFRGNEYVRNVPNTDSFNQFHSKRTFSLGISRWASKDFKWELDNFKNNSFYETAIEHAVNKSRGTTPTDLAPYAYAAILKRWLILQQENLTDYFIAVVPKLEGEDPVNPKLDFNFDAAPQKIGSPMTLVIGGVERGKGLLFTDQGVAGANTNPTDFTDNEGIRFVIYATGDANANALYGVPYSGWLDSENIPQATDTAAQQARRFYNIPAASLPSPVTAMKAFSLYDSIDLPYPDNAYLRGLRIYNEGYKIKFFRMYMGGTDGAAEKLQEILCTRDATDWIDKPDDELHAIDAFVNQAAYPLQIRVTASRNKDEVNDVKFIPIKSGGVETDVLDLVSNGAKNAGNLQQYKVDAYKTRNMIIPSAIWNQSYCNDVTPIINFYPVVNSATSDFVSVNRKPVVQKLVQSGLGTARDPYINRLRSNVNIITGDNIVFRTRRSLYEPTEPVNPFLVPNITSLLKYSPATQTLAIKMTAQTADLTTTYTEANGSYELQAGNLDPVGLGIYVHLQDLPNRSIFGSMNQVNTKLIGCINKVDSVTVIQEQNNIQQRSLCWNAYEKMYVDLNNPSEIEVSQLSFRLTDRYMNPVVGIENTQLVLYLKEKETNLKNVKSVRLL